jgi:hypothetical protein
MFFLRNDAEKVLTIAKHYNVSMAVIPFRGKTLLRCFNFRQRERKREKQRIRGSFKRKISFPLQGNYKEHGGH